MCRFYKGLTLKQYVERAVQKEKEIISKEGDTSVFNKKGVFEKIHDLGKNDGIKFRLQKDQKDQNVENVDFSFEEDSSHYVISLENLNLTSNGSLFNRTKDFLQGTAFFMKDKKTAVLTDDKKVYLCMLFWFMQVYFRHDQKGMKGGCEKPLENILEQIKKECEDRTRGVNLFLSANYLFSILVYTAHVCETEMFVRYSQNIEKSA